MSNKISIMGSSGPVMNKAELIGRENVFRKLDEKVNSRYHRNIVLMGMKGSGKSSVLRCYFDIERRIELVKKYKRIYHFVTFPTELDEDGIFGYLIDYISNAVDILEEIAYRSDDKEDKLREYEDILELIQDKKNRTSHPQACLDQILDAIFTKYKYTFTIIIDDFHNFTLSTKITFDDHSALRELLSRGLLSAVAATDYNLTRAYIAALRGTGETRSLYIHAFEGNDILVPGLNLEETKKYMYACFPDVAGNYTDEEMYIIQAYTSGIPDAITKYVSVLNNCMERIGWCEETVQRRQAFEESVGLSIPYLTSMYNNWCKLMDIGVLNALKLVYSQYTTIPRVNDRSAFDGNASELAKRGMLLEFMGEGFPLGYKFPGRLFGEFFEKNKSILTNEAEKNDPDNVDHNQIVNANASYIKEAITLAIKTLDSKIEILMKKSSENNIDEQFDKVIEAINNSQGKVAEISEKDFERLNIVGTEYNYVRNLFKNAIYVAKLDNFFENGNDRDDCTEYIAGIAIKYESFIKKIVQPLKDVWDEVRFNAVKTDKNCYGIPPEDWGLKLVFYENFIEAEAHVLENICSSIGYPEYDAYWWNALSEAMCKVRQVRNKIHEKMINRKQAKSMLDYLFVSIDGNGGKTNGAGVIQGLMVCSQIHEALENNKYEFPGM
ncbi:MAG: ATP-binding protein [Clostridia bacterium]|nr:ATP-binding protein [Clostridia bacterium]